MIVNHWQITRKCSRFLIGKDLPIPRFRKSKLRSAARLCPRSNASNFGQNSWRTRKRARSKNLANGFSKRGDATRPTALSGRAGPKSSRLLQRRFPITLPFLRAAASVYPSTLLTIHSIENLSEREIPPFATICSTIRETSIRSRRRSLSRSAKW